MHKIFGQKEDIKYLDRNGQYHSYKGTVGKVADNILARDFHSDKPFEKITTDVTQFNVCNEKVYLSPVMDLFNREIIPMMFLLLLTSI